MLTRRALLAGAATAAATTTIGRAANEPEPVVLKIVATPSDDMTPIVYGQKSGLFRRFGLDLQVTTISSGAAAVSAVASGTYDIGKTSLFALFDAREHGLGYRMVAADVVYDSRSPYVGFIVRKEAGIRTGSDLNNKIVAVSSLGDIGSVALQAWVDQHGGDAKTLKFVELPLSAASAALDANRVTAAETSIPVLALALAGGKLLIPAYDTIARSFLLAAFFTTSEFSNRHPELVRAFSRAFAAAGTYTNAHHAETVDMMSEFTGVPVAIVSKMSRALAGTALDPALIQPVIEAGVRYGAIKQSFPARDLIDPNAVTK